MHKCLRQRWVDFWKKNHNSQGNVGDLFRRQCYATLDKGVEPKNIADYVASAIKKDFDSMSKVVARLADDIRREVDVVKPPVAQLPLAKKYVPPRCKPREERTT